jgi:ABC-type glycerol-3-phosphate transport system substrate-binding protein
MRTRLRWPTVLIATALLLAACGGGDDDETGGGGESSAGTVEVAAIWSGDEQAAFKKVLDAFTEETGIKTRFTSTGDDIATVLGSRLEGGKPPDVAILPQPGLMKDLVGEKALQPIEDLVGTVVDENFAPVWRELGTVDGQLYGVWFKAANKSTIWYRPAAFEDAGIKPPKDFDELVKAASTLSDAGTVPFSIGGGDGWTLTDWFENVYLRTAGPEMYDKLAAHEIPWTDASVKEALTTLGQIFGKPEYLVGGVEGALSADMPKSVTQVFSEPSKAAMVFEGDFVAGTIKDETEAKLGEDADFFPFPAIGDSGKAIVGGGDVAVLLKDSEPGQALIKFLATPEAGAAWAEQGGFTSPNKALDAEVYPDDITRRSAQELVSVETFRFDLSDLQPAAFGGTSGQGMWKLLQDFIRTPTDIDGITGKLEEAAAAAFKK